MDKSEQIKIIEEMQQVVNQMKLDDIEENPNILNDFFDCDCCGKNQTLAGSIRYGDYRLCNDCVLKAEIGFALNKFNNIKTLVDAMENNRLEEICKYLKDDENRHNN